MKLGLPPVRMAEDLCKMTIRQNKVRRDVGVPKGSAIHAVKHILVADIAKAPRNPFRGVMDTTACPSSRTAT